ncbi:MAG TPA: PD-(D/E)XK nuclease family protein [Saprospiraceae bacterium]|nr:PD-(D/E)XK nuclease family protein [Saprospiraceae bacterium]
MYFLERTAEEIYKTHQGDYKDVLIVSPNRRAALFLQKILRGKHDKPVWSPELMTMDDVVRHFSPYEEASRLNCIYQLFLLWKTVSKRAERFERFYFWGDRILNDFDRMEKYLVAGDRLFLDLKDEKVMEARFSDWKEDLKKELRRFRGTLMVRDEESRKTINGFLELWQNLGQLKKDLDQKLEAKDTSYMGRIYAHLGRKPELLQKWKGKHIYFVGFNRRNACEERIMEYAEQHLDARFFWNYDVNLRETHKWNNAGLFLCKDERKDQHVHVTSDWNEQKEKSIDIYGVQRLVGQAKWIGEKLDAQEHTLEDTVIILPDESMLLPVLSALPDTCEQVNVSMGISLRETPAYTLLESYLILHENALAKNREYHYTDIQRILHHPYVPLELKISGQAFVSADEILDQTETDWHPLFNWLPEKNQAILFDHFLAVLEVLHKWHVENQTDNVGLAQYIAEVLVFAHQKLSNLKALYQEEKMTLDLQSLLGLIRHYFQNARIPFLGEPLKGLQILGPLESRNLDFKKVYLPSLNEGIFPGSSSASLIPFNLQKAFGLPTPSEESAEEAYYFYMSIARAEQVHLSYNSLPDDTGSKEKSRFVQNIELNPGPWGVVSAQLAQKLKARVQAPIIIAKDVNVLQAIQDHLQKGVSNSAIQKYLDCSLKYYFRYIAELRDEIEDDLDYSALNVGRILHKAMEEIYEGFKNKEVTPEDIDQLKNRINPAITHAFKKEMKVEERHTTSGQIFLIRQFVGQKLEKILSYDCKIAPFHMQEHEFNLGKANAYIEVDGEKVKINGFIDRIDEIDGVLRLSDYKTGNEGYNYSGAAKLDNWARVFGEKKRENRHKLGLQLAIYALALKSLEDFKDREVQIAHYALRELSDPKTFDHRFTLGKSPLNALSNEDYEQIEHQFSEIIREIKDPDLAFVQTENEKTCSYCPYRQICKR